MDWPHRLWLLDHHFEETKTLLNNKEKTKIQRDWPTVDSLFWHNVRQDDEAAMHTKRTTETEDTRVLKISSTMAHFNMKLVRHDGHGGSEEANLGQILSTHGNGEKWTLLDRREETLVNEVEERTEFEKTDYFFRLHPQTFKATQKSEGKNEFVFIKYWPAIRDHHESNNWLSDVVSASLVVKNKDGTYRREASIIMKRSDCLATRPIPRVIELR